MFLIIAVPVLIAVTVGILAYALASPPTSTLDERLKAYGYNVKEYGGGDLSQPFTDRIVAPLGRGALAIARGLAPDKMRQQARARLDQAGNPMTVNRFLIVRSALMFGLPVLILLPRLLSGTLTPMLLGIAVFAFFLGGRLPDMWLSFRIDARSTSIRKSLPDALDLITVCVEAGYGLEAAVAKVTERTKGPLSEEFNRALAEIRLGKPRREALRDLSTRARVSELQSFIAAILQADQLGVSIGQVLRVQADAMRIRRQQRAEELALQAPVKMLFPMFIFIFPVLLVVILTPAAMRMAGFFALMKGR